MKKLNKFGLVFITILCLGSASLSAQSILDGIVFNEILVDPNGTNNFDTDGDGTAETGDEFIELYNTTGADVDVSGWEFWDGTAVDVIPATTIIPANGFLVLVSGYAPATPPANFIVTGGSLGNSGDDVFLYNPTSDSYIGLIYGTGSSSPTGLLAANATATLVGVDDFGSDSDGLSIQAIPDGSANYSILTPTPGATNDAIVVTSVSFAFATTNVDENAGTANVCLAITNPDAANATTVVIDLNASSVGVLGTDYSLSQTGATATPPLTLEFPAGSSADTCIVITGIDDTMIEGDEAVIFDIISVTGGTSATVGTTASTTITLVDDDFPTASCVNAGDLVITEFMQNPSAVGDAVGEWFEVYNPTAADIDMIGYTVSDAGSENFTIDASVIVPTMGYAVFAINGDMAVNGGVVANYEYSGYNLSNGDDEIIISCNGLVIDSVYYDGGTAYPDPTGASASLDLGNDASSNDTGSNWCEGTSTYGSGDFGTPGAANDACAVVTCTISAVFITNEVCTGSDFSYEVNFTATSGSGMYDVVDNATSTILATGATSPITITIVGNTSAIPFDIYVQDNMDVTCTSSASLTSVTPIDCSLVTTCVNAGDLVVTEFMQNPTAAGDATGEWFEVYNPTANDIDMFGYMISDAGADNFTISASVIVSAGGYAVFAINGDMAVNGGIVADYEYSGMTLSNGDDEIIISCGGVVIDSVYYDGGTAYPDPTGASSSLDLGNDASSNDTGSNWCESTSTYGSGDLGTPGAANDACVVVVTCPDDFAAGGLTNSQPALIGNVSAGTMTDFETPGVIISTQVVDANTDYDSGTCIEMNAGFEVILGTVFDAFIDTANCNAGAGGNQ